MIESPAHRFEPIAVSPESTVVAEFVPDGHLESRYQSEAELEAGFIELLKGQAYEHLRFRSEADLVTNLRTQLEVLNGIEFSDAEWERFFTECVAGDKDGIVEKTARIQEDHVQLLRPTSQLPASTLRSGARSWPCSATWSTRRVSPCLSSPTTWAWPGTSPTASP